MKKGTGYVGIRLRVIFIVLSIAIGIITSAVVSGIIFIQNEIHGSTRGDLTIMADMANQIITGEINRLKSDAAAAARFLLQTKALLPKGQDFHRILEEQMEVYPDFMGFAVFDSRTGRVDAAGAVPPPEELMGKSYMQRAFAGQPGISTTEKSEAGGVVMYVLTPLGEQVLAATLPGLHFSQLLSNFLIWETGHIFVDDIDGTVISNFREEWVNARYNFIELSKENSEYKDIARVVSRLILGETGVSYYSIAGVKRICAYRPIEGSGEGWCLGVVAPLAESPLRNVIKNLILVGVICLILSCITILICANIIAKPYEEAARLKEVAEAASKAKTNFLANMSHEMRTPLNAVIGLSELTLGGSIGGEDRENTEKVYNSGMTLLGIVNDILDLSKLESGKFDLVEEKYELPSLINDTISLNTIRIGSKPIQFHLHIDSSLPKNLYGDDLRIKQIFNNLLSNALKYTRQGTVDWTLSCEREGDTVWFIGTVSDTGIGIKPEDIQTIFATYNQVDVKSNRTIEGTGLGLAITSGLVEKMQGTITVESEYGKGSTFTVRLRQQFAGDAVIGELVANNLMSFRYVDRKRSYNGKMARIKLPYASVLVVDDVSTNLDVARGILKPYGMQVDCVSNGQDAVDKIRAEKVKYNAIFMDHMMPGMDGIEAARIIREEIGTEYAKTIPIIALTANAIIGNEDMFLARGFQEFLSKPIDIVAMDAAIRRWVRNKAQEEALGLPEPEEIPIEPLPPDSRFEGRQLEGIDFTEGLKWFGGNGESYLEVLQSYLQNTPPLVELIRNPRQTESSKYRIAIHGIKGSSRNIGAEELGQKAEELERAAREDDFNFISTRNGPFIQELESFMERLSAFVTNIAKPLPRKPAPDAEVLTALLEACRSFDVDRVDAEMARLTGYQYDAGSNLIAWLAEQADQSGYNRIIERLSQEKNKTHEG